MKLEKIFGDYYMIIFLGSGELLRELSFGNIME